MDKEQIDSAVEWVNEGKSLDDWLRVNGYTNNKEEAKAEIETALSGNTPAPKPEVEDDEDWDEEEDWEDDDEDDD